MGLKRRGTGRRPVLNLNDKHDTSRRTWQTKYQQICADHMIKNGVRAGSPMQAKEAKERSDAQQNCGSVSGSDSSLGAAKNPLVGLLGQYNSDSDEDGGETEGNKTNSAEKGGGLDAKVEDFMREIQALVPEPVKEEGKSENLQQEVEVSESDAWQQCYDHSSGYVYFWNVLTNEVSWEPPPGYDTELLQPYSSVDASQATMSADYSHVPPVTPEQSVVSQQMMPGVPMSHVMPGVPPSSAAAASAYAMKMPYGMPGVGHGHAHSHVGMMHPGYPAAPAQVHPHHQAYLQLKQKSTSKLKVPGLEDEEDEEEPYRPSMKATASSSLGLQAGGPQQSSLASDAKTSASNDAEESYDGKIEMITSFSQDSDDEEELSSSSVEKARPPPKRRKGDAVSGPCQAPPVKSLPTITQPIPPAMDVARANPGSSEGPAGSSTVPKSMLSVIGAISNNVSSLNSGMLPKDAASGVDQGKVVFKSQAPQQHESSKDVALFPSTETWADEKRLEEKHDVAKSDNNVEVDKLPAAKVPAAGREEKKPPPLSLIAAYGAEDSEDEDSDRHKESRSLGTTRVADKSAKPLFPISVDEDEEMLDSRAFRRKRRIQVASTSKARMGNPVAEKNSGSGEGSGRPVNMVENMAKLAHLWSDRESREEGGERRGLGFGGSKEHVAPVEEGHSSKGQRRKAGLIAFVKAETINLPPSSEQEDFEKKVDPSVEKLCQDLWDKVEFLQEGSKDLISPVQEISIEMQALRNAYVLGALSSNYFGTWLQERWAALERTEEGAAPPGWVVQWCRYASPATTSHPCNGHSHTQMPPIVSTLVPFPHAPPATHPPALRAQSSSAHWKMTPWTIQSHQLPLCVNAG